MSHRRLWNARLYLFVFCLWRLYHVCDLPIGQHVQDENFRSTILLLTPAFDIEAGLLAIVPATSDEKTEQERSDVRKEEVDEKKQE
jgi:hypothetical protein